MSEVTSVRVYLRHLRANKICHKAGRKWWARQGLSWSDFVRNGIDGQVLLDTNDPVAARVVKAAELEAQGG